MDNNNKRTINAQKSPTARIWRNCRKAGCNALTDRRDGYCLQHARQSWRENARKYPTATARGYGADWQRIRKHKLAIQPFCEVCEGLAITTLATEVHHADGCTDNNAMSNLVSICRRCHMVIHRGGGFGRAVKLNGDGFSSGIRDSIV